MENIIFARDIRRLMIAILYRKGHSLLKFEGTGVVISVFVSRGSDVTIIISINQNT